MDGGGGMLWLFVGYAEVGAVGFGRGVAVSSAILFVARRM